MLKTVQSNNKYIRMGGNFLLFILMFIVMLDPTNSVLHLKNLAFVALLGYSIVFYKPVLDYLPYIIMPFVAIVFSYISATVMGNPVDVEFFMGTIKGFSMLLLLLWVPYYNVLKITKITSLILSIVASILFILVMSNELIEAAVFTYVCSHDDMIMMSHRSFLGINVYGMYYKSLISTILPFYLYCYALFVERKHVFWNSIAVIFITFSFAITGTRSTMLLPIAMIVLAAFQGARHTKWMKMLLYPLLFVGVLGFLVLVYKLATEKGETSNMIKYAHLASYARQFYYYPEYYIWGQGAGSWIYSAGFRSVVTQTEWTYIELFRMLGLATLLVLTTLAYPLYAMRRYVRVEFTLGIAIAYIMFLFISGTNPLLVSSTGMAVVLMGYAYVYSLRPKKLE